MTNATPAPKPGATKKASNRSTTPRKPATPKRTASAPLKSRVDVIKALADFEREQARIASDTRQAYETRHQQNLEDMAIVARRAEFDGNAKLIALREKETSQHYIATGKPLVVDKTTQDDPNPAPEQKPEPVPPAPPAESPVQTAPTVALEPQQEIGLPAAQEVTRHTTTNPFNPRGWKGLQRVIAVTLGLIGLIIGIRTVGWATSDWNNDWWQWVVVTLQVFCGFLWVIAITGIGFFGGALLGAAIPRWRQRRIEYLARRNTIAPPAPPTA